MGKAFRRNQTFVIQIAISIALPPLSCEALDGYIQLGARTRVTQVLGTSVIQLLIRGCSLKLSIWGGSAPKGCLSEASGI